MEFRQPGIPQMLEMLRAAELGTAPVVSLEVEKPSLEVQQVLPLLQPGEADSVGSLHQPVYGCGSPVPLVNIQ